MSSPLMVVPKELIEAKPRHGHPCNRCGLCCMVGLCQLAQHIFSRPEYPGPCPALVQTVDGDHSCGVVVQPGRFNAAAAVRYGEKGMRAAALLLINSPAGCDLLLRGEQRNHDYTQSRNTFDRKHAAEIAGARKMWGFQ